MLKIKLIGAVAALSLLACGSAGAQNFPTRDLAGSIMWGAGGAMDGVARAITPLVEPILGKSIILTNRTGGTGAIATKYVDSRPADGYNLLYGAENPQFYKVLGLADIDYDNFYAVGIVARGIAVVVVRADAPWKSLKELIEDAKKRPNQIKMGTTGVGGLPATAIAALLIGLAMVSQALYWLELAGQPELVGQILVLVLVREIAPLVVAFIVIGRTGSVMVIELGRMEAGGQLRALDAQGVDPLLYLILPRVLAMAVSTFCLTVAFLAVAFVAGNLGSLIAGFSDMGPTELADLVLGAMGPAEFALVAIKSLGIGFLVGLVVCLGGLAPAPGVLGPERKLPRVFVLAVLTTFLVSAMVSAVL